jgi:hypothetical protein
MTEEERTEIKTEVETDLRNKYFLIPRDSWWKFLGGALAFLIAVGGISYKSALTAISAPAIAVAKQKILDAEKKAEQINAGHLKFKKMCVSRGSNNCQPIRPPCPNGFVDAGVFVDNYWKGGNCGEGEVCRLCYAFTDQ